MKGTERGMPEVKASCSPRLLGWASANRTKGQECRSLSHPFCRPYTCTCLEWMLIKCSAYLGAPPDGMHDDTKPSSQQIAAWVWINHARWNFMRHYTMLPLSAHILLTLSEGEHLRIYLFLAVEGSFVPKMFSVGLGWRHIEMSLLTCVNTRRFVSLCCIEFAFLRDGGIVQFGVSSENHILNRHKNYYLLIYFFICTRKSISHERKEQEPSNQSGFEKTLRYNYYGKRVSPPLLQNK